MAEATSKLDENISVYEVAIVTPQGDAVVYAVAATSRDMALVKALSDARDEGYPEAVKVVVRPFRGE